MRLCFSIHWWTNEYILYILQFMGLAVLIYPVICFLNFLNTLYLLFLTNVKAPYQFMLRAKLAWIWFSGSKKETRIWKEPHVHVNREKRHAVIVNTCKIRELQFRSRSPTTEVLLDTIQCNSLLQDAPQ